MPAIYEQTSGGASTNSSIIGKILPYCPPPRSLEVVQPSVVSNQKALETETNLADLRDTLGHLNILLSQQPTKETEGQCLVLLNHISTINLPPEIKYKEAGYFSAKLQEHISEALKENGQKAHVSHEMSISANNQYAMYERIQVENLSKDQLFSRMGSFNADMDELRKENDKNFLNLLTGPVTPEKIEEFNRKNQENILKLQKNTKTITQNLQAQFPNMTEEEKKRSLQELNNMSARLRREEEYYRNKQAEYLNQRDNYPKGSSEWTRYNVLANGAGEQANAYAQCAQQVHETMQVCSQSYHHEAEQQAPKVSSSQKLNQSKEIEGETAAIVSTETHLEQQQTVATDTMAAELGETTDIQQRTGLENIMTALNNPQDLTQSTETRALAVETDLGIESTMASASTGHNQTSLANTDRVSRPTTPQNSGIRETAEEFNFEDESSIISPITPTTSETLISNEANNSSRPLTVATNAQRNASLSNLTLARNSELIEKSFDNNSASICTRAAGAEFEF